ncbi:hypothetical protein H0H93_007786 [Arthromyces matolae]|nr:hypothetical protein H0H93_007786 [Arthromyces matolae]
MFNLQWQWGILGVQIDSRLEGGACVITFTAFAAVERIFNIEAKVDLVVGLNPFSISPDNFGFKLALGRFA